MENAHSRNLLTGIKVGRYSPPISHLFFADDTIIFSKATLREVETALQCIQSYEAAFGQQVNFDKIELTFSRNVPTNCQNLIRGRIRIKTDSAPLKYLGLPTMVGKSKKNIFSCLLDRVQKKLKGWKALTLSQRAREILIKCIAQAIPTYIMSCFAIPISICHDIKSAISRYWWGGCDTQRKIHWISWDNLCLPKNKGGMGFRAMHHFNMALLAKQGWRLLHSESSLVARVFKGRYYPRTSFLEAKLGHQCSYAWRSILEARNILTDGCIWRVGNGQAIHIWQDNWIPHIEHKQPITAHTENRADHLVSTLIDQERRIWKQDLIAEIFLPSDIPFITNILLSRRSITDVLTWPYTKDFTYSVRSGYHWLREKQFLNKATSC